MCGPSLFQPVHQLAAHRGVVLREPHDAEIFLDRQALVGDCLRHFLVGLVEDLSFSDSGAWASFFL